MDWVRGDYNTFCRKRNSRKHLTSSHMICFEVSVISILGDQITNASFFVFSTAVMSYIKFKVSFSSYQCLTQSRLTSVCLAWVSQTTSELSTLFLPGANLRMQLSESGRGRARDFLKAASHSARGSEHGAHEHGFGFQGWNCFLRLHWKNHVFSASFQVSQTRATLCMQRHHLPMLRSPSHASPSLCHFASQASPLTQRLAKGLSLCTFANWPQSVCELHALFP